MTGDALQLQDDLLNKTSSVEQKVQIEKYKIYNLSEEQVVDLVVNAREKAKENEEVRPVFQELADEWKESKANMLTGRKKQQQLVDKTMQVARDYFDKHDDPAFADDGSFARNMKSKVGGDGTSRGINKSMELFVQYLDKLSKQDGETQDKYFKTFPTKQGGEIKCLKGTENNLSNLNAQLIIANSQDDILLASDEAIRPLLNNFGNGPHSEKEKKLEEVFEGSSEDRSKYVINFKDSLVEQVKSRMFETIDKFASLPTKYNDVEEIITTVFPDDVDEAKQEQRKTAFADSRTDFKDNYDVDIRELIKYSTEDVQWDRDKIEQALSEKVIPTATKDLPLNVPSLEAAIESGYEELFDELLQVDKSAIHKKKDDGSTYLHSAARSGSIGVLQKLIDEGLDVNEKDSNGDTALHLALKSGHPELAKQLLAQEEIEFNSRNNDGQRPLNIAARNGYTEISEDLAERVLDKNDNFWHEAIDAKFSKRKAAFVAVQGAYTGALVGAAMGALYEYANAQYEAQEVAQENNSTSYSDYRLEDDAKKDIGVSAGIGAGLLAAAGAVIAPVAFVATTAADVVYSGIREQNETYTTARRVIEEKKAKIEEMGGDSHSSRYLSEQGSAIERV